jgi:hypothetical protein
MPKQKTTGDSDNRAGKRYGCLLYSLSFLGILVLAVGLPYLIWHADAQSELDSEIARIKSRGEPLFFSDLAPQELDPESDGTALFLLALAKIQAAPQRFYDRVHAEPPSPPGDYPELAIGIAANQPALDLLRQATAKPHFRLPIDYQTKQPFLINLDPIQNAREFAWLLQADVIQSLGTGDMDRAVAAVQECLGLSEMLRDEPFIITQLVRYAIAFVAMQSLETVVGHGDLTPEQFVALDEQLDRMQCNTHISPSIIAERCAMFTTMSYLAENPDILNYGADDLDPGGHLSPLVDSFLTRPYVLADQAYMLRIMTEFANVVEKPGVESSKAIRILDAGLKEDVSRSHLLTRAIVCDFGPYCGAALRFRQRLLNTRLALRIARYRQEHGELPRTLADILDDKVADAVDVYTGQPLVYEMNPEGFLLYPAEESVTASVIGFQPTADSRKLNMFKAQFKNNSTSTSVDSSKPQEREAKP